MASKRARAGSLRSDKRASKKEGIQLKDLPSNEGRRIRGGVTVNCGTGMSKGFYEWIKSSP